jgi:hypothetical protein
VVGDLSVLDAHDIYRLEMDRALSGSDINPGNDQQQKNTIYFGSSAVNEAGASEKA